MNSSPCSSPSPCPSPEVLFLPSTGDIWSSRLPGLLLAGTVSDVPHFRWPWRGRRTGRGFREGPWIGVCVIVGLQSQVLGGSQVKSPVLPSGEGHLAGPQGVDLEACLLGLSAVRFLLATFYTLFGWGSGVTCTASAGRLGGGPRLLWAVPHPPSGGLQRGRFVSGPAICVRRRAHACLGCGSQPGTPLSVWRLTGLSVGPGGCPGRTPDFRLCPSAP